MSDPVDTEPYYIFEEAEEAFEEAAENPDWQSAVSEEEGQEEGG